MTDVTVLNAISTVGFPIVAFLMMFWLATRTIKENTIALRKLAEEIRRGKND